MGTLGIRRRVASRPELLLLVAAVIYFRINTRKAQGLSKARIILLAAVGALLLMNTASMLGSGQPTKRPFTVNDDIQLVVLGGSSGVDEDLLFSPDGEYFVVESERGRPDLNGPEDSLRFYRSRDVEHFIECAKCARTLAPDWVVKGATDKEGPIFKGWRWLANSTGVAFLERTSGNNYRLVIADVTKKRIEPLTSDTEAVEYFDVRDRQHYVYTGTDPTDKDKLQAEQRAPEVVGTGRPLFQLLTGDPARRRGPRNFYLWVVVGGKRFQVKKNGAPLIPGRGLSLSPDGDSVIAALPVADVPSSWETLYPPALLSDPHRIRSGQGWTQWVRIDVRTGSIQALTDAPRCPNGTWATVFAGPSWSSDGRAAILPDTFLKSDDNVASRPCVAVVDLLSNTRTCLEILKGLTETGVEEGLHHIQEVRFVGGDKHRVLVRFRRHEDLYSLGNTVYGRTEGGAWHVVDRSEGAPDSVHTGFQVSVRQGLNEPPLLVATNGRRLRVIWNPNPQLANVELARASIYTWKAKDGRQWRGALFKPSGYKAGERYPLVIQTHGLSESKFIPSGIFPTAFAARALAAQGIMVLQVPETVGGPCPMLVPAEGACAVAGYEGALNQLVSEGLVDPKRIGIIGFSRTCFYVMETLTTPSFRLRAASITDGVMADYLQYLLESEWADMEFNQMIGAEPFGEGLQQWLRRSPSFNLDKIDAPLLIVGAGPLGVLNMWGPYAGLRHLHKPVDLIMLNTDEHVLTTPAVRLASQGGSVDWFRFWLSDYEDPDPAKCAQYQRWRELRKMQAANERKLATLQSSTN
jgi:dipeptidyl aminopeptidase/acylaminoacyl peptidase